jgi:fumarate reductase flavoprotein subunit
VAGILPPSEARFTRRAGVLVVGGGAAGLCAALAARERGCDVLVIERDPEPRGTTAMSIGLIPAAPTRFQRAAGIVDRWEDLAADILAKNHNAADRDMVARICAASAPTVEWLVDRWQIPLDIAAGDHYPGHGKPRMHGTPQRSGAELMAALAAAARRAGIALLTGARATDLFSDGEGRIHGARIEAAGSSQDIACESVVLACCGFAADATLVGRHLPEIASAHVFAHHGSQGDAVRWGEVLGAALCDLDAYQSHGGFCVAAACPVPWAHILRGGIQVNATGRRFSDESRNYAERALDVLAQPGGSVWSIFDARIESALKDYAPYRAVADTGAVITAADVATLRAATGLPAALEETLRDVAEMAAGRKSDPFGRTFSSALAPPYKAVAVTGALYHTQGGLAVDGEARVQRAAGGRFPNLFAAGGAARGISGPGSSGYLAGNGLLTAVVLGRFAGEGAAAVVGEKQRVA